MLDLDHIFKYHAPTPEQLPKYEELRAAAKTFAEAIIRLTPPGADQTAAIRKVREATFTANSAIALGGRLDG
jgi:hypothetical protein